MAHTKLLLFLLPGLLLAQFSPPAPPPVCMIVVGASNGAALAALDIAPQIKQCKVSTSSTIVEITVDADTGTSSVQLQKRHCSTVTNGNCTAWTNTNLLTGELPTLTGGFPACATATAGSTCRDATTSSATVTISTPSLAAGDYIETSTSTLTGAPKIFTIAVTYQ